MEKITLKKSSNKSKVNYIQKVYQQELNKVDLYLLQNGLSLAIDKTKLMLFNSGLNPNFLPQLKIQNIALQYTEHIKFLGVTLTPKLNWNMHIKDMLNKAASGLNILKVISSHKWGQNTVALRNVATALVRSKLTYAQEIFFNAPNYLLNKIQSTDCKAYKIALGLPYHTNNLGTYTEIDIAPLDIHRKACCSKFILKSKALDSFCQNESQVIASETFAKRGINIKSVQPIGSFAINILNKLPTNGNIISPQTTKHKIPPWLLKTANFDMDQPHLNKSLPTYILKSNFQEHRHEYYANHLFIYTDGSKLDNGNTGAAFYIPSTQSIRKFHLGKHFSIFTAEIIAIQQALLFIQNSDIHSCKIVFCVDSYSALTAIKSYQNTNSSI